MNAQIPSKLIEEIRKGNVIAFVGAGFSTASGLPTWPQLLMKCLGRAIAGHPNLTDVIKSSFQSEAQKSHNETQPSAWYNSLKKCLSHADFYSSSSLRQPMAKHVVEELLVLIRKGDGESLDQAAQILEDENGEDFFCQCISDLLETPTLNQTMLDRIRDIKEIPFKAVLTTNFNNLLPGGVSIFDEEHAQAVKLDILRSVPKTLVEQCRAHCDKDYFHRTLQLHGSIKDPKRKLVFTRKAYRNLIHGESGYLSFLKAVMSKYTVLYIGFSFSDDYLNDVRSSVLSMFGKCNDPLAYSITCDKSERGKKFFREHEGIEFISYTVGAGNDHDGFDQILRTLRKETAPLVKWNHLLRRKRVLFVMDQVLEQEKYDDWLSFLGRCGISCDAAHSIDEAFAKMKETDYDLIITRYGHREENKKFAIPILAEINKLRVEFTEYHESHTYSPRSWRSYDGDYSVRSALLASISPQRKHVAADSVDATETDDGIVTGGARSRDGSMDSTSLDGPSRTPPPTDQALFPQPKHPPIVLVFSSSHDLENRRREVMGLGATHYVCTIEAAFENILQTFIPDGDHSSCYWQSSSSGIGSAHDGSTGGGGGGSGDSSSSSSIGGSSNGSKRDRSVTSSTVSGTGSCLGVVEPAYSTAHTAEQLSDSMTSELALYNPGGPGCVDDAIGDIVATVDATCDLVDDVGLKRLKPNGEGESESE